MLVSPAGAVGLTQLMLGTARGVAKGLGIRTVREADSMNPSFAIRIGASYLGNLLRRYGGSEALALAAYNVEKTPVKGWLGALGSLPLDAFVEEIPVQETEAYVKRVLRSYAAYRYLYGSEDARPVLVGQVLPESSRDARLRAARGAPLCSWPPARSRPRSAKAPSE